MCQNLLENGYLPSEKYGHTLYVTRYLAYHRQYYNCADCISNLWSFLPVPSSVVFDTVEYIALF